jgi:hypothetical protein
MVLMLIVIESANHAEITVSNVNKRITVKDVMLQLSYLVVNVYLNALVEPLMFWENVNHAKD